MSTPDPDGAYVDDLLRQAQAVLGDPRVRFAHVRHTGPLPSDAFDAEPHSDSSATSVAHRAAWTHTVELAAALRELWQHAWLPDPPTVVNVRYLDDSGHLRVEVSGHSETAERIHVDAAADRLLVRGFLPDEQVSVPGRIRAHGAGRELVVDATGSGVSMILSDALDIGARATPATLAGLPAQVSLIADGR